jgi:hypothetical protein
MGTGRLDGLNNGRIVMASNYPEELGDWVKRRRSSKPASRVAGFLAIRDDVEAAIDAGFPMKTIWAQMTEGHQLNVCYDTFRGYVHRYISNRRASTSVAISSKPRIPFNAANEAVKLRPVADRTTATSASPLPGFIFNPHPKKEELI